ncbi:zinc-binding protein A33-like [Conger conger]|uniref:zinc-binding protein A33-like n=1 Tax=Conger conger TaxID=82655 RepID=UPI002A5A0A50|nr:zinc-binding protein A33-like [Conger conger]
MEAKALIPEDDLCCSVCCDIFKEPVVLKCSHSFCRVCLQQCWEEKSSRECPICRRKASMDEPPLNLALKNIVESYLKQKTERETADKTEARCSLHGEKLVLFCEHDKEPLCLICQTSKKHRNHPVCPVEEAALELKEELKPALNLVKEKLKKFTEVEQGCKKTAEHIRGQAQHTERQIKAEFEKLHQFLHEEEEARLAALKEEEEQKSRIMEEKLEHISGDISTLTDKITAIETAMETEDNSILKDPELLSGALIDVAKHLGNLTFRVWEKMLGMVQYTPMMMDPNTACATLSLSDDLTTVRDTDTAQNCPDNPKRFYPCLNVLGSEGFTSGKHSWEVKVGNKREWDVGVVKESINRKGNEPASPGKGYWIIWLRNGGNYRAVGVTDLTLERKPQSIRVQLDYDRGEVSFFNSSDMSLIYTFKHTFTERVFPFFSPWPRDGGKNDEPLTICPVKVSVTVTSSQ